MSQYNPKVHYLGLSNEEFLQKEAFYFQNTKKVKALKNLETCVNFATRHKSSLKCIKSFLRFGYLETEDETYLTYLLDRYEIDYLDWSYRSPWTKEQIRQRQKMKSVKAPVQLQLIDFNKKAEIPLMPIALIEHMKEHRLHA